jgi:hypothetical protein
VNILPERERKWAHKTGREYRSIKEQSQSYFISEVPTTASSTVPVTCNYLGCLSMDRMQQMFCGGENTYIDKK